MTDALTDVKNVLANDIFGVEDVADYISRNTCICCNKPDALSRCHTEYGAKDFSIMGICEHCYDGMFSVEALEEKHELELSLERNADELPERDFYEGDSPDY